MANTKIYELMILSSMLLVTCQGAPYLSSKLSFKDNNEIADAVLPSVTTCDPATGRCWDYWPKSEDDVYPANQDGVELNNRQQLIRVRDVDQVTNSWRDAAPFAPETAQPKDSIQPVDGNQVGGRLAKKNIFASRGWGAGGMPFSVLYIPRTHSGSSSGSSYTKEKATPRNNEPSARRKNSSQQQQHKDPEPSRVSVRNGVGQGPNRKPYSIIPQLFVSYGWGPSGK